MKISQIFGFSKNVDVAQKTANKQDLTSFGVKNAQQNNAELISKDAAQALKDKYLSQPSFAGHVRTLEIKEEVVGRTVKLYNTCGEVVGYDKAYDGKYTAKIAGHGNKTSSVHSNEDDAIIDAIKNSKDYIEGSRINKESYGAASRYNDSYFGPSYSREEVNHFDTSVYFTDRNEEVDPDKREGMHYVVYAPGAKNVKKSFFKRLFG